MKKITIEDDDGVVRTIKVVQHNRKKNEDGTVDVSDLNIVINTILSINDYFDIRADVNADGEIDVADVNMVINSVLSGD